MSYGIQVQELRKLIETRNEEGSKMVDGMGGPKGLAEKLKVDLKRGVAPSEVAGRKEAFGENSVPDRPLRSYLGLLKDAMNDKTLFMLCGAAVANMIIFFAVELPKHPNSIDWIEGVSIILTVILVSNVAAMQDYRKERQFAKLNAVVENAMINVIREGQNIAVSKFEVVVGDLVRLTVGDILECDGVLVDGADVEMDESALTGEPILISKTKETPYMLSGTTVQKGQGKFICTAVGVNSENGRIQALVRGQKVDGAEPAKDGAGEAAKGEGDAEFEEESSVLTRKLNKIADLIGNFAFGVSFIAFLGMIISYAAEGGFAATEDEPWEDYGEIVNWVITTVTIVVVAIPEGLPLAVTLALSLSVMKMQTDNNLVKHLDATETMGSATTICSDKTGTLTQNRMTVMRCHLAGTTYSQKGETATCGQVVLADAGWSKEAIDLLGTGICLNKAEADIEWEEKTKRWKQMGNKTDCALLAFADGLGFKYKQVTSDPLYKSENEDSDAIGVKLIPFSSSRKRAAIVVKKNDGGLRVYVKGASEMILALCQSQLDAKGSVVPLTEADKNVWKVRAISEFAKQGMRTIGLAYKDLDEGTDLGQQLSDEQAEALTGQVAETFAVETKLNLISIVGIEDPVRDTVPGAIEKCNSAGIDVRMVTGDHQDTAVAIAKACGIVRPRIDYDVHSQNLLHPYTAMTGDAFRKYVLNESGGIQQDKFDEVWPHLRVLARSSPSDKYVLVTGLKESALFATPHGLSLGLFPDCQVVAVTGDGTNDAPALKKADVGFAMGITGTRAAQDAADIILLDDDFASIVQACMWGRNVHDSIAKFLQFQLTVNISAVTVACVGAFVAHESPLKTVQMLWVNLIMDSLGALALASEPPVPLLLKRPPYGRNRSLISLHMWWNMLGQSFYQLVFILIIYFSGGGQRVDSDKILPDGPDSFLLDRQPGGILNLVHGGPVKGNTLLMPTQHYTMIFNTFVWCQLFNWINCRKIYHEFNVFAGIQNNMLFIAIWCTCCILQVLLVEGSYWVGTPCAIQEIGLVTYCNAPLATTNLTGELWGVCLAISLGSFLWQWVIVVLCKTANPGRSPLEQVTVMEFRTAPTGVSDVNIGSTPSGDLKHTTSSGQLRGMQSTASMASVGSKRSGTGGGRAQSRLAHDADVKGSARRSSSTSKTPLPVLGVVTPERTPGEAPVSVPASVVNSGKGADDFV